MASIWAILRSTLPGTPQASRLLTRRTPHHYNSTIHVHQDCHMVKIGFILSFTIVLTLFLRKALPKSSGDVRKGDAAPQESPHSRSQLRGSACGPRPCGGAVSMCNLQGILLPLADHMYLHDQGGLPRSYG